MADGGIYTTGRVPRGMVLTQMQTKGSEGCQNADQVHLENLVCQCIELSERYFIIQYLC